MESKWLYAQRRRDRQRRGWLSPQPHSPFKDMKTLFCLIAPTFICLCWTLAAKADGVVTIELPAETTTYRQGQGMDLAQNLCITCHSADYAEMQPPMPRKFWEGAVKKMKEKFGAPIPDDAMPKLVDYLTSSYGVDTPAPAK